MRCLLRTFSPFPTRTAQAPYHLLEDIHLGGAHTYINICTAQAPYHLLEHGTRRLPDLLRSSAKAQAAAAAAAAAAGGGGGGGKEQWARHRSDMNALVLEVSDALGEVGDADGLEGLVVWVRSNSAKLSGVREMRAPWLLARAMQVWHA